MEFEKKSTIAILDSGEFEQYSQIITAFISAQRDRKNQETLLEEKKRELENIIDKQYNEAKSQITQKFEAAKATYSEQIRILNSYLR